MKVMIITSLSGSLRMKHLILNKESDTGESGGGGNQSSRGHPMYLAVHSRGECTASLLSRNCHLSLLVYS